MIDIKISPRQSAEKRMRLPKRIFQDRPAFFEELEFRPAKNKNEVIAAAHLVYREYLAQGYISANDEKLHFSKHQALPTTVTFVVAHKTKGVIGTVTLAEDSSLGVPMDTIYNTELNELRSKHTRFAEICRLAMDEHLLATDEFKMTRSQRLLMLFHLYKSMYNYFRASNGLDELVACFHPRHEFIYQFLGFTPLGSLKPHPAVQGSPAVARRLSKKEHIIDAITNPRHQDLMFYWEEPAMKQPTYPLSIKELAAFSKQFEKTIDETQLD